MSDFLTSLPGHPQTLHEQAAYVVGAIVIFIAMLAARYPDRLVGTHAHKELPKLPGTLPIIGNTYWIWKVAARKTKLLSELDLVLKNKPNTFAWTASFPGFSGKVAARVAFLSHPLYIQWCQKTNFENYNKGNAFFNSMSDVLGPHGIFVADGEAWKRQRKMASNIFSVGNFRTHVQSTIQKDLETFSSLLGGLSKTGKSVDLQDIFFRFTLSSFSAMAFSAELGCLPSEPEKLDTNVAFATNFDYAQLVMDARFVDPLQGFMERFNSQGRKVKQTIKNLNDFCYNIVDLRLAAREKGTAVGATDSKAGKDLLELFIDMGLGREELLPVVLNFLIAGRDTTAQTLSWLFYELWRHPEVVAEIRKEAESVLGVGADARKMAYDDIKSLPYLNACFNEASRVMWPAVPKNTKIAVKDDVIRPYAQTGADSLLAEMPELKSKLPDVVIKAGESVIWSDYAMARMPEIWGPDAGDFKPKRFLTERDGERSIKTYSQYKFHSFNAGPRLCLGQTLATYEGMACTIGILSHFDVVYDDAQLKSSPPIFADSLTLPIEPDPKLGSAYRVSFRRRE